MCPASNTACPAPKHHSQLQKVSLLSSPTLPNVTDPQRCVCWSCRFSGCYLQTFSQTDSRVHSYIPLWNLLVATLRTNWHGRICSQFHVSKWMSWMEIYRRSWSVYCSGVHAANAALVFCCFSHTRPSDWRCSCTSLLLLDFIHHCQQNKVLADICLQVKKKHNSQCNVITDLWGEQRVQMDSGNK